MFLDGRHTNARGFLHGGLLVAVADTVMGHTIQRNSPEPRAVVTVSSTTDFVGTARADDWLQDHAQVERAGRRMSFGACRFHVGDRLIMVAHGVFATVAGPQSTGVIGCC